MCRNLQGSCGRGSGSECLQQHGTTPRAEADSNNLEVSASLQDIPPVVARLVARSVGRSLSPFETPRKTASSVPVACFRYLLKTRCGRIHLRATNSTSRRSGASVLLSSVSPDTRAVDADAFAHHAVACQSVALMPRRQFSGPHMLGWRFPEFESSGDPVFH